MNKTQKNKQLAAAKRVIKKAGRDCFKGAWNSKTGYQYITNGFCIARFSENIPLPEIVAHEWLEAIFTELQGRSEIVLPEISELKAAIRLYRSEHPKKKCYIKLNYIDNYDKESYMAVNAEYLRDVMELVPDGKSERVLNPDFCKCSMLYLANGNSEAILLPVFERSAGYNEYINIQAGGKNNEKICNRICKRII